MQGTTITKPKNNNNVTQTSATTKESLADHHELFYSIHDPNSALTFANNAFVEISKYDHQEILGQPHHLIRHPDMPQSVDYVMGNYLKKDIPVAAYIKNIAKDGSYYWLLALVFPCDNGYLSVSIIPGSETFKMIKSLYENVHDYEKKLTDTDKDINLCSSYNFMVSELKKLGYPDYNEFMWNALQNEMDYREEKIAGNSSLSTSYKKYAPEELLGLESILSELVLTLGDLKQIHRTIAGHSEYILNLSRSVQLLSMNAQIGASKLDKQDRSLSVVAEKMGEQSISGEKQILEMQDIITQLSELIGDLNFDIISSKLQTEMTKYFIYERAENETESQNQLISNDRALELLYNAFVPKIDNIANGIGKLPILLKKLLSGVHEVERFLLVLRFVHIKGKVEIARMNDEAKSFSNTFHDLIEEVNLAESRLDELSGIIRKHQDTGHLYAAYQGKLNSLGKKIRTSLKQQPDAVVNKEEETS